LRKSDTFNISETASLDKIILIKWPCKTCKSWCKFKAMCSSCVYCNGYQTEKPFIVKPNYYFFHTHQMHYSVMGISDLCIW